jgi:hypothetical protein
MRDQWYYKLFGAEFGPVSFDRIFELAGGGSLKPDDEIRQGPEGEWARADSIVGLFPELEQVQDLSDIDFQFVENSSRPAVRSAAESAPNGNAGAGGADQWYCEIAGRRQLGPMSWHDLQELARQGELSGGDRVRNGPKGLWSAAAVLEGLLEETTAAEEHPAAEQHPEPEPEEETNADRSPFDEEMPLFEEEDDLDFYHSRSRGRGAGQFTGAAKRATLEGPRPTRPERVESAAAASAAAAALRVTTDRETPAPAAVQRPLMPSLYESATTARPTRSAARPAASRSSGGGNATAALASLLSNGKVQTIAAVLAVGALIWYFGGGLFASLTAGTIEEHQKSLESIYTDFEALRSRGASSGDWASFTERVDAEQREIIAGLQLIGAADDPAGQELIAAARYDLSRMVRDARTRPNKSEESYKERLAKAAQHLKGGGK